MDTSSAALRTEDLAGDRGNGARIDELDLRGPATGVYRIHELLLYATGLANVLRTNVLVIGEYLAEAKVILGNGWGSTFVNTRDGLRDEIAAAEREVVERLIMRATAFATDGGADLAAVFAFPREIRRLLDLQDPQFDNPGYPQQWSVVRPEHTAFVTEALGRVDALQSEIIAALLEAGVPEDRILAALQGNAVASAEDLWEGGGDEARPMRRSSGWDGAADADWCGMFVVTQFLWSGLDQELRAGFYHTENVRDFFDAGRDPAQRGQPGRVPLWIEVTGSDHEGTAGVVATDDGRKWMYIRDYHALRGSERSWLDGAAAATDIRRGDVVLCGEDAGTPTHIAMVHTVLEDGGALEVVTIEGNASGIVHTEGGAGGPAGVAAASGQPDTDLGPTSGPSVVMNDFVTSGDELRSTTGHTFALSGRGRPSLVDFEAHTYAVLSPPAR